MIKWFPVPGYESRYEVSEEGYVRSLPKINRKSYKTLVGKIDKDGYQRVLLYDGLGSRKMIGIHQIVALTFIGNCPVGMQVMHKDGDNTNNHLSNLEYGTPKNNFDTAVSQGTHYSCKQSAKTHCPQGHEYSDINTYKYRGMRQCKICRAARSREQAKSRRKND